MERYRAALNNNKSFLKRKNKYITDSRKTIPKKYLLDKEEIPEEYINLQDKLNSQDNNIFTSGKNKGKKFIEVIKDKKYNKFILNKKNLSSPDILQYKEYLTETKILNEKLLSIKKI